MPTLTIYETNTKSPIGKHIRYPVSYPETEEQAEKEMAAFRKKRREHYDKFGVWPNHVQFLVREE